VRLGVTLVRLIELLLRIMLLLILSSIRIRVLGLLWIRLRVWVVSLLFSILIRLLRMLLVIRVLRR
jgi:hypothetical protein